jgi:methionyl-tRNA formyltransferase
MQPTPVKSAAMELGVRVYEPAKLRAFVDELKGQAFDLFALASYGRILPQALIDFPKLGALNVHPSLLPKYRGATPIQTALREGERETGVSIMLMDAGMDTGDIVLQETFPISPDADYGTLHDELALFGGDLLGEAISLANNGPLPRRAQSGDASLTRPIGKEDTMISLDWPPERVINAVRAFSPQPGARLEIEGETIKVLHAHVEEGAVVLDEVVAPNRGRMTGESYLQSRRDRQQA